MIATQARAAISLLEVILAFSAAYLAQSMRLATNSAIEAQDLARAELAAESVLNQVIAGVISSEPVSWSPYVSASGQSDWLYMIQSVPAEVQGMIGFQIAVKKNDPLTVTDNMEYDLAVTRWIIDPALELDTPPEETDETTGEAL